MMRTIFLILLFIPLVSFGDSQEIQEVTAEGVGSSERLAVEDAFRNAIEESIGLYVDSETKLQNDQLISDKILTSSKGYIEKYRLLSVKNEGSLVKVKIKALVKIQDVKTKLTGLNISTIEADDSAAVHARLSSKLARSQDAEQILKKELGGFFEIRSILDLLEIKLTGYKVYEDKLSQDNTVPYEVSFVISVNLDNYNEKINEIERVFNNIGGTLNKHIRIKANKNKHGKYTSTSVDKEVLLNATHPFDRLGEINNMVCFGLVFSEGLDTNTEYTLDHYCFPSEWKTIYPWAGKRGSISSTLKGLKVILQFTNNTGAAVHEKKLAFKRHELGRDPLKVFAVRWPNHTGYNRFVNGWGYSYSTNRYRSGYIIAPFIKTVPTISITYKDRINIDLLYDIQKVNVGLEMKN